MNLTDLLRTDSGVLSVVGSGGKSTLVNELARELGCTVIIATSTHMLAPEGCPLLLEATELDVEQALWYTRVVCVGRRAEGADGAAGKLCAPSLGFGTLAVLADRVLVEADGSRRLPLKAHAAYEPAVPSESSQTIQVVGASGFGGRVGEVVHRPQLMCETVGCSPSDECTPELYARFVAAEHAAGLLRADDIVVNQADDRDGIDLAARFASELRACGDETPVAAGSVREHRLVRV